MAAILIRSLRSPGQYAGAIAVHCPVEDQELMAACQATKSTFILCPWMNDKAHPWELDRVECMRHIGNPEQYATVTLLDSDIICLRDINPTITNCEQSQRILHTEELWQRYKDCGPGHHEQMYLLAMTPSQRQEVRDLHPINAGTLTWPGHLTKALMEPWLRLCVTAPNGHAKDQATLNAVLRFGGLPIQSYDPHDVGNASQTPEKTWREYRLLHFAGFGRRIERMTKLAGPA